jgi:threonine synthase
MRYRSTRGDAARPGFSEILLEGLAADGGLYMPESIPSIDAATLESWRPLSYAGVAFEVLSRFADDLPAGELRTLVDATYTAETFGDARIVPLESLEPGVFLLGLANGPTLAFKDLAMQFLGRAFESALRREGRVLNVLGATSGDTGSAAEHALRGKRGIAVFMLSPDGRMSPFQQAQMYSLQDANIHNLAIAGVFDDCQDLVKAVSADPVFKAAHAIATVNSINWARVAAQVVYYAWGWLRATSKAGDAVSFTVPTGNFGNVCAGHIARRMGVPIRRLVVATNENDVVDEFFRTGVYRPRAAADTHETSSPSMDISKASNLERFVFDLVGGDAERTRELFARVAGEGGFALTDAEHARVPAFGFTSGRSTGGDRTATIRATFREQGRLVDPHTADALSVARRHLEPGVPMLVLETAQPAKFSATVREATGREPPRPRGFEGIEALPKRVVRIANDVAAVKAYLAEHAVRAPAAAMAASP